METLVNCMMREPVEIRVHDIVIKGNTKTKEHLIEAEIEAIRQASTMRELLQASTVANAKLRYLEIFDSVKVTLDAGPSELPGTANVIVEVTEAASVVTGELGCFTKPTTKSWTLEGHGGSDGLHGFVPSLDFAVADLKSYIEKVRAENPGLPCFCFGHSTGGAIIIKAMIDPKVETCIDGVVLTSPAVGVQPTHPIFMFLAPLISFLLPRYQLSAANKTGMPVSRDPAALVAKYSDPLVYTGAIRARTGYEILRITTYLQQNLRKLKVPFLVLHGTADTVTDPKASQKLYNEASSTDKTIKLYEGLLHDLLFEPEREAISEHIIGWLKSRV